jgi:hypothetical protein
MEVERKGQARVSLKVRKLLRRYGLLPRTAIMLLTKDDYEAT